MAQPAQVFFFRRPHGPHDAERKELMASLAHTRTLINQAYGGFNTAKDGDLINPMCSKSTRFRPATTICSGG